MDFYKIETKSFGNRSKQDYVIEPDFKFTNRDLVCKGGSMYGYWYDGMWRTNKHELIAIIDKELYDDAERFKKSHVDSNVNVKYMDSSNSGVMEKFLKYCKNMPESDVEFNTRILFSNHTPVREDYSTTQLSYSPSPGPTPAFDEMFNLLYEPPELEKILWFIGATLTNSMYKIQKFLFLYGGKGSGKGTVLAIFKMLFEGYYSGIDLHKLTSGGEFSTSGVKETQLLIDDDADISVIKDDTALLKLTAHDPIIVNNKYQSTYSVTFKGLLVAASNQKFKVRNIDAGITRRAVVAIPTEVTHKYDDYMRLMSQIKFELPAIAQRAIDLFNEKGPGYYQKYVPVDMMESTDHFYAFMREQAVFLGDSCNLKTASERYKLYLEDIDYGTEGYKKIAKEGLKRYYKRIIKQRREGDVIVKNIYEGLKWDELFPDQPKPDFSEEKSEEELIAEFGLKEIRSAFDEVASTYPAQYTNKEGFPKVKWDECRTTLSEINTNELHYVRVPINHIVLDFDIKNEGGEKDLSLNLKAARKFPETYTELSKSGKGVHLHYIYDGDVDKLASEYDKDIEVKVYKGKSSLRRMLSLCNDRDIAHISSGLPEKEETLDLYKDIEVMHWNESKMRKAVKGNLEKKYHGSTRPSVDFIVKIFDDAVKSGAKYDLQDMRQDILSFAASSTNQSAYCIKAVSKIKFSTVEQEDSTEIQKSAGQQFYENKDLWFYDVEVFPNLFIICFKRYGENKVTQWINPTREQVASLVERPLVGFNNRRYDNHILYAALLGEDNLSLYRQSQRIINDKNAGSGMYSGAYELSYTDIYDYCNAGNKMSLKKWEVKLGVKHDEFELPWDQPVPEDMWERAAEYCCNDVEATEATFNATQSDYNARRILATLSGLSMNSTTNQHTTAIIFEGKNKKETASELVYTDLSKTFPGYKYSFGKSEYREEDPGEGGYVYAEPGVYTNVALLDVASMHPTSAIELNMFGKYTQNFEALMDGRLACKHDDMDSLKKMFDGRLVDILNQDGITLKDISNGLKTAINSVYGLTSAGFENAFRHPSNNDNIVAKRGALFMIDLKHEVQKRGYIVAHIKTDSIKIPNASQEIIDFVFNFGKKYGYTFEHEDTYRRLALVNKSTYICQDQEGVWHATGAQFADPYVFKTLFTKEPLQKEDFFVTKEVKNASVHLGDKFIGRLAEVYASETGEEMFRVTEDKKGSISGTKGYKWKLSKDWSGHKDIDMTYYKDLVEKAVEAIDKVGIVSIILDNDEKVMTDNVPKINGEMVIHPEDDPFSEYFVHDKEMLKMAEDDLPY